MQFRASNRNGRHSVRIKDADTLVWVLGKLQMDMEQFKDTYSRHPRRTEKQEGEKGQ